MPRTSASCAKVFAQTTLTAILANAILTVLEAPMRTMSLIFAILHVPQGSLQIRSPIAVLNTAQLATIGNLQAQTRVAVYSRMLAAHLSSLILSLEIVSPNARLDTGATQETILAILHVLET